MSAIIVSGGDLQEGVAASYITKEKRRLSGEDEKLLLVAADRGLDRMISMGIEPDLIIGDFDSASEKSRAALDRYQSSKGTEVILLNPVKDDTDTEAAIRETMERSRGEIILLGATGGHRLDHLWANLRLLGYVRERERDMTLLDAHNRVRLLRGPGEMRILRNQQYGKYLSVFPLDGRAEGVSIRGVYYPLQDATLCGYASLTVSNEITEEEAVLTVREGDLLVMETRD
ncbi:MAG: thiamine diphosphokinase [Candidatus Weimeria sp.]|nr:thiamine diphosphokinase [Candidatus Weimeria sp.]